MTSECTFTLANSQKCHGSALRNQEFCRHHAPSSVYTPPAVPTRHLYTPRARWCAFGRQIPFLDPAEVPNSIYQLLESLTLPDPSLHHSDLVVGRNLRLLLSRLGYVPFPSPGSVAPAPQPSPRQPLSQPHTDPVDPAPTLQLHSPNFAPEVHAALEAIAQDSTPEAFDALMAALAKGEQDSPTYGQANE